MVEPKDMKVNWLEKRFKNWRNSLMKGGITESRVMSLELYIKEVKTLIEEKKVLTQL